MPTTPKHSVSVAGIVVNDQGRVLVIRRDDNGRWEPPGGVLELDESPEDGVRREVFEETGIHVAVQHLTGVYKNLTAGIIALVFRCHPDGGQPHATAESREVRWMTPEQAQAAMSPAFAVRVLDAIEGGVHTRIHDGVNLVTKLTARPRSC